MVKGEPLRFIQGHQNRLRARKRIKGARYSIQNRGYETPCWIWLLAITQKGYGQEWDYDRQRMVGAHIIAFERTYGAVPAGLEIHHLCGVRECVNPSHLRAVTHTENVSYGDYAVNNHNARKKHCPQGHPYSGDNLMIEKSGTRRCKQCRRERGHRR